MPNRGKLVIGVILGAGVLAAVAAWWYTYQHGQRILTLWGPEAAYRIRLAPECELLTLEPASSDKAADLVVDSRPWSVRAQTDISQARGFVHARQALIEDSSYRWDVPSAPSAAANWQYAIRFRDSDGETLLLFDLQRKQILDVQQNRRADIAPIAAGLVQFFQEQLPE